MAIPLVKLAILAASILPLCVYPTTTPQCKKPVVRKEWRTLSTSEKTDWIRAVNVSQLIPLYLIFLELATVSLASAT